jgi:hypothetical protein
VPMLRKIDEENHAEGEVVSVGARDQVLVVKAQVVLFFCYLFLESRHMDR